MVRSLRSQKRFWEIGTTALPNSKWHTERIEFFPRRCVCATFTSPQVEEARSDSGDSSVRNSYHLRTVWYSDIDHHSGPVQQLVLLRTSQELSDEMKKEVSFLSLFNSNRKPASKTPLPHVTIPHRYARSLLIGVKYAKQTGESKCLIHRGSDRVSPTGKGFNGLSIVQNLRLFLDIYQHVWYHLIHLLLYLPIFPCPGP